MRGSIFVIDPNNNLVEMRQERYKNEASFQTLIEKYPNLLAGEQINPENPRRWIFIARELGIPSEEDGGDRWFLDHLFIDQDAIPTLVEVKRSTDTRIRREVIAQMLDYAANATSYWSIDMIQERYEEQLRHENSPSLASIGITPEAEDRFWQTVEANLQVGKMRLLFVADQIPMSLQSIIEFLNRQMTLVEVLGLEIRQYTSSEGMKTLVPRIIGRTASAVQAKQREKRKWSEAEFMEDVLNNTGDTACVRFCEKMLRACENMGLRIWWGEGKTSSGFVAIHDGIVRHQLFAVGVRPAPRGAVFELYFQHLKAPLNTPDAKQMLKRQFEQIKGLRIPNDKLDKRPTVPWKMLAPEESFKQFVDIIFNMKNQIVEYEKTLE